MRHRTSAEPYIEDTFKFILLYMCQTPQKPVKVDLVLLFWSTYLSTVELQNVWNHFRGISRMFLVNDHGRLRWLSLKTQAVPWESPGSQIIFSHWNQKKCGRDGSYFTWLGLRAFQDTSCRLTYFLLWLVSAIFR